MKTIEFIDWLNLSLTGNQLRVSNSFLEIWVILSSCRQYRMHLFCVIWILLFIFWVRLVYQADEALSMWGWIRALHNNLRRAGVNFFFLCKNLSLKFILLITFRAIDHCIKWPTLFVNASPSNFDNIIIFIVLSLCVRFWLMLLMLVTLFIESLLNGFKIIHIFIVLKLEIGSER